MTIRAKFLLTCVTGALVIGAGPMISASYAADMPVKAMPAAEPVPFWWFSGELEVGGRFFTNNPQKDGINSQGGKSLAKFYEYRDLRPGPFGNFHLGTGTSNGLYQIDVWGKNVGYDDQRFDLNASKAGEHYFNFQWDETPHLYSDSAQTIYNGVGTNALTLPAGLSNQLFTDAGCKRNAGAVPSALVAGGCGSPLTAGQAAAVQRDMNNALHQTDIGIRRDTASVDYRWTPTDAWDIRFDYSHMHRWGTQVEGVVFSPGTSGSVAQVPKPVDDTTQNFGVNGEYAGSSSWGKYTIKVGYAGSVYQDANNSYTVENPFCGSGSGPGECARTASPSSPQALMSLWPNNQSNGFSTTVGADLPAKSRYMGTFSYNMMRQNDSFLPFTNMATVYAGTGTPPTGNVNPINTPLLPASSLSGSINTTLANNVLTTQITPTLKSKLSYRYYDYDNGTPEIFFPNWVLTDVKLAGTQSGPYAPVNSLSLSYTKQNAGAELNWRPERVWNVGAAYGFERYDWTRTSANVTNENSGKVYTDWTPDEWLTVRASWLYSQRRYEQYDYVNFFGAFQWPNDTAGTATRASPAYRQFYLDNRDRNKGQLSVAVDVLPTLTVTPTVGWKLDDYRLNPNIEEGLQRDHSWNAGVEVGYLITPDTRLLFSYMNEQHSQIITSAGTVLNLATANPATQYYSANVQDRVNTFMFAADHAFIPGKLDVGLSYTVSTATDSQPLIYMNGGIPGSAGQAGQSQYPDVKTTWQRFEAKAQYKFDRETVQQIGWKGDVTLKLRYAWESNSVGNWQNDFMQTYMWSGVAGSNFGSAGYMTWLAYNNPNYNVQLVTASLVLKW
jgi:MtrB/PioB family decaheme-associated outer membrane protein